MVDYGSDFSCVDDILPDLSVVSGQLCVAQAVARRLLQIQLLRTENTQAGQSAAAATKFEGEYAKIMGPQEQKPAPASKQ